MALEFSVVVPLCNEQQNLPTLHLRLTAALRPLAIPYEIIYVDDGSTDHTAAMISELHEQDAAVRGVFLSRNFGHQAALCAGLEAASGRAVVTIDGDLQDPPEVIPALIDKWREGYQVVFARRRRRRENFAKRAACFLFYRVLRGVSEVKIPLDTGDFALMDRLALEELNSLPERRRFIRGLRTWIGFKQAQVLYDRDARLSGRSKYPFMRLARLGLDGIFAFSQAPLKAIPLAGLLVMLAAIGGLVCTATGLWGLGGGAAGLVWLGSGLALLAGVQLVGMGILGEYLARIYDEVRGRPLYVTRTRIGFKPLPRPVPNVLDFLPSEATERQEKLTAARLSSASSEWAVGRSARETGA